MRYLYSFILYLLVPLVLVRLLWNARYHRDYIHRWKERFGFIPFIREKTRPIWIHAVSVGEVQAARPLIKLLMHYYPDYRLLATTTTPTGADTLKQYYGEKIKHIYFPYDLPGVIKRYLNRLSPSLIIILETEIWPNLIHYSHAQSIPVALVNCRMSEKSAVGYRMFLQLATETIEKLSLIIAQTEADAERILEFKSDDNNLYVTGNLKFDIEMSASIIEHGNLIRQNLSSNRPVWIAASTHPGEEELLLTAFKQVLGTLPDCLLIIAPRHPERAARIQDLCTKQALSVVCKSEHHYNVSINVFILDTLGELPAYYAAADIAFVGGSLVPVGGHNMLEPASLGLPVISGPHIFNFSKISQLLCENEIAWITQTPSEIVAKTIELLSDANLRHNVGNKARRLIASNEGSAEKTIKLISDLIK